MGRLEEYLNYYTESIKKYGEKTAVLYQCGNFYEMYGINNETEQQGNVEEVANILNIQLTRTDKSILENNRKNPLFAGFNLLSLDKFVKILMDNGYTAVIINQDKTEKPGIIVRQIDNVYSPGTYLDYTNIENYFVSIFINKYEIGLCAYDIGIGKIYIYNIYQHSEIDDCYRFLQTFKPREVLITFSKDIENDILKDYKEYFDLGPNVIFHNIQYIKDYENIKFQNEFLKQFYNTGFLDPIEFLNIELYSAAITAYCILLIYCKDQNKSLLNNLQDLEIKIWSNNSNLILENNAINQLNLKEIFDMLNKTKTKMGSRLLKERLYNPIYDVKILNERYDNITRFMTHYEKIKPMFKSIGDLTKTHQKIGLNKLKINEVFDLIDNYQQSIIIIEYVISNKLLNEDNINIKLYNNFIEYYNFLTKVISKKQDNPFTEYYNPEIFLYENKIANNLELLKKITSQLSTFISSKPGANEFISIDKNTDLGYFFQLTPARFEILKKCFKPFTIDLISVKLEDFSVSKKSSSNVKLYNGCIQDINFILEEDIQKMTDLIAKTYEKFILDVKKYKESYNYITDLIAEIDLYTTIAQLSIQYKYVKPIIIDENKSCFKADNLRHPLIEQQDRKSKYIPFSIYLEESGVLLYGINSSGKSSTMKAVGLAVIMAQSGFFVAADKLEIGLYHNLMTRILNSDNIFKGLSSFAVEMIELRSIISRMSKNSLILGDEICHGTETNSAVSIITASIILLSQNNASFIFATHLHKLSEIDEITKLSNVKQFHLTVSCDEITGEMVYDRKIKPGPGDSNYGIEVAKFLKLSPDLISIATQVRNKYFTKKIQLKSSKYNKGAIMQDCAICGDPGIDMHHIYHQAETINDYVDGMYIHDKKNLVSLCSKHHEMVHKPTDKELIIFGYENEKLIYTFRQPKL